MELFPTQMSINPLFALPSGLEITAYSHQEGMTVRVSAFHTALPLTVPCVALLPLVFIVAITAD